MTYANAIAQDHVELGQLLKIEGLDRYFADFTGAGSTYDDAAGGATHGSQTVDPILQKVSISPGKLDYKSHQVTDTTASITLHDSAELRSFFSRRVAGQYTETALTLAGTSVTVADASAYDVGSYQHIGTETIKVTARNLTTDVLTIARAQLGSIATEHPAGTEVASTPRRLTGRRVYIVNAAKGSDGTWYYDDPAWVMSLEKSPRWNKGAWTLSAALSLRRFDVPVYRGFREAKVQAVSYEVYTSSPRFIIWVDDVGTFLMPTDSAQKASVLLKAGGVTGCFEITAIYTGGLGLQWVVVDANAANILDNGIAGIRASEWFPLVGYNALSSGVRVYGDACTASIVYPTVAGCGDPNPAQTALRLMLSRLGDGARHADYDVMPGQAPSTDEPGVFAGAGLRQTDVDVAAWKEAGEGSFPSVGFVLGGGGQESLMGILTKDVAPLLGGYVHVTRQGLLSFKRYDPVTVADAADITLTSANMAESDNAVDDEAPLVGTVQVKTGYDWGAGTFTREHNVLYGEQAHTYGDKASRLSVQSRMAGETYNELLALASSYMSRWGKGSISHRERSPWAASSIAPGDRVSFTQPRVPDFAGGQGETAELYEVISARPERGRGSVVLELARLPTVKLIAPAAELHTKYAALDWYLTAVASDTARVDWEWADGWVVQFIDPTGTLRSGGGVSTAVIQSRTFGRFVFSSGPTDLAVGDTMIFADYGAATGTATSTDAGAAQADHAFISSSGYNPSGSLDEWG